MELAIAIYIAIYTFEFSNSTNGTVRLKCVYVLNCIREM